MTSKPFDAGAIDRLTEQLLIVRQRDALQQWADQFRRMPGGLAFLQEWARQWRQQAAAAVLPKHDAATSDLLAGAQEDVIETILKEVSL